LPTLFVPSLKSVINFKIQEMKKILLLILFTAFILQGFTRDLWASAQETKKQEVSANINEKDSSITVTGTIPSEKVDTSLTFKIGNRNLIVLESLEGQKVTFEKTDPEEEAEENEKWVGYDKNDYHHRHSNRKYSFKGHWADIEFGFNNYLGPDKSIVLPEDINYMTLHSSKSTNFTINFAQLSLGFSDHSGLVTGLGINWNNYKFDGNNNIVKGENGVIEELDPGVPLEKSKLATVFLTVPLLFEFQIPVENHSLNIAFGPIGALKLDSHSKMVYEDGNKVKSHGDFSLNITRYGFTARAGYGNFQLYGTYYMKPLFQTGKSPGGYNLYPCEIGIAFAFND
jgi:hypothetical protein